MCRRRATSSDGRRRSPIVRESARQFVAARESYHPPTNVHTVGIPCKTAGFRRPTITGRMSCSRFRLRRPSSCAPYVAVRRRGAPTAYGIFLRHEQRAREPPDRVAAPPWTPLRRPALRSGPRPRSRRDLPRPTRSPPFACGSGDTGARSWPRTSPRRSLALLLAVVVLGEDQVRALTVIVFPVVVAAAKIDRALRPRRARAAEDDGRRGAEAVPPGDAHHVHRVAALRADPRRPSWGRVRPSRCG